MWKNKFEFTHIVSSIYIHKIQSSFASSVDHPHFSLSIIFLLLRVLRKLSLFLLNPFLLHHARIFHNRFLCIEQILLVNIKCILFQRRCITHNSGMMDDYNTYVTRIYYHGEIIAHESLIVIVKP